MAIKCYACQGKKEFAPLGGIIKKCGACGGVGYKIEPKVTAEHINDDVEIVPQIEQKKRGRPKSHSI